jgi:A/G-specific adenine glycosylase
MAQQTQIKTMLPYFDRWMLRFPDFESLAVAPEADVLKHWEGLGYYSRARNLHKLAKAWVAAAPKPCSRAEWQKLPGIGPYTSAAISSIVFNEPDAVVDGNVVRLLARLTGDTQPFNSSAAAIKAFFGTAQEILNRSEPGDHNQAMMELGATVCLKRKPLCPICPVAEFCKSRNDPQLEGIPRIARKATERIDIDRAWVLKDRFVLLFRIPETAGQLAGQYELPRRDQVSSTSPNTAPLSEKIRSITHRRIRERIFTCDLNASPPKDCHWVALDRIDAITLSGPHRRWITELLRETTGHANPKLD